MGRAFHGVMDLAPKATGSTKYQALVAKFVADNKAMATLVKARNSKDCLDTAKNVGKDFMDVLASVKDIACP